MSMYDDVKEFHKKFEIDYAGPPRGLGTDRPLHDFRVDRLSEEVLEYIQADTMEDQLDALVDLVYVALGTAVVHGFNKFDEAWDRVHAANMAKVRVLSAEDSRHGHATDIKKPPGWTAPDLSDLVK